MPSSVRRSPRRAPRRALLAVAGTAVAAIALSACLPATPAENGRLPDASLTTISPSCRIVNEVAPRLQSMIADANKAGYALAPESKSYSIVAPPDGEMHAYMDSLHKLKRRSETIYYPGHGPAVRNAPAFVDRYIAHRDARETAILRTLERGETDVPSLVRAIYIGLDPRLANAAGLMTFAQLEDLVARKKVMTDTGTPSVASRFRLA